MYTDLTKEQKDYAVFLPALSGFYATFVGKQRFEEYVDNNRIPYTNGMESINWLNKKDGELTGEILEIEDKKAIIRDNKGRKIKVLISKLKETIPPDVEEERLAEDSSSSEEQEQEEEKSEENVIKVGSKVKWERRIGGGFEEETGEVVKISEKTYQICCKKNGKNYFVNKNEKTLTLID